LPEKENSFETIELTGGVIQADLAGYIEQDST
jgi:hypothetical protein